MDYEETTAEIISVLGLSSEEELLGSLCYGLKAVDKGLVDYEEAISLGLLEAEDVVERIGVEKAVAEGVLTEAEAVQWKKETEELKSNALMHLKEMES